MQDKTATRTLSIRLPSALADRLDAVAKHHGMTRTAVLIEILDGVIDTWQPATQQQDEVQHDTLHGAIESMRLELDETIERLARLERARHSAAPQQDIVQDDTETFTTSELCDRFGWSKANAARSARSAGWQECGKRGNSKLWRKG